MTLHLRYISGFCLLQMSPTTQMERNFKEVFVYFFVYKKLSWEFNFLFKKLSGGLNLN